MLEENIHKHLYLIIASAIWMFHSKKLNNHIDLLHEKTLRLVYKDKKTTYQELLQKDNYIRVHHRNPQFLATEHFKVKNDRALNIMKEVFQFREPLYNLYF